MDTMQMIGQAIILPQHQSHTDGPDFDFFWGFWAPADRELPDFLSLGSETMKEGKFMIVQENQRNKKQ